MLHVSVQESGSVTVFRCVGQLVAGHEVSALINKVILHQRNNHITLDLTGIDKIDARGLGVLVLLNQWSRSSGVKLRLIPSRLIRRMLELTGLARVFEIQASKTIQIDQGLLEYLQHLRIGSATNRDDDLAAAG